MMTQAIPRSGSRKVNGYVKATLALEAVRLKREARYDRYVRALDQKRDRLIVEVETRRRTLTGAQMSEARWILGAIPTVNAFRDGGTRYYVPGRKARTSKATTGGMGAVLTTVPFQPMVPELESWPGPPNQSPAVL